MKQILGLLAVLSMLCITPGLSLADSTETSVSTRSKKMNRRGARKKRKRAPKGPSLIERQLERGTYGLALGFVSASLNCDCNTDVEFDRGMGFHGGVTYDKSMTRAFSVRGEGLFSSRSVETDGSPKTETTLNYLEIGGQGMLRFQASRLMAFYVLAGPYVALLLDADVRVDGTKNKDAADNMESIDAGFSVGAGGFFALSNSMKLLGSIQLAYKHGLLTITGEPTHPDDETFNRGVALTAGVHF